jgi:hypothetical protein
MEDRLSREIDALDDLDEITEEDFVRIIKGNSSEAFQMRRDRKNVRYRLYRIQKEFLGGPASEDSDGLRAKFEADPAFRGWRWFGITWDVSLDDPFRIVRRDISVEDEWNAIIRAKFPTLSEDGRITYPDIKVKEKVRKISKERDQKKGE